MADDPTTSFQMKEAIIMCAHFFEPEQLDTGEWVIRCTKCGCYVAEPR